MLLQQFSTGSTASAGDPVAATAPVSPAPAPPPGSAGHPPVVALETSEPNPLSAALALLKEQVRMRLIAEIDQARLATLDHDAARQFVAQAATELLRGEQVHGIGEHRIRLAEEITDDVLGLGPLEPLLRDATVSEIMVNGPSDVYVERRGRLHQSKYAFRDEAHLAMIVDRIIAPLGRHVDEASPMVDARLPDGSRVNVVVPPASPRGITITLRKFARERLRVADLVQLGTLTDDAATFLRAAVQAELNVLIAGGTGTGKTTLLNILSSFIDPGERIVTIEDPLELQLQQPHVVALEARPPGIEGGGAITQRDLVRNAMRMRPDRIVVGEVRGGEAFDMLQAMNTGHDGSLSTVHANTPRDAVSRVVNMVLMAGLDLPDHAIMEQFASAIDVIVQIGRLSDGSRRITQVTEVVGMEGRTVVLQDIFAFAEQGQDDQGRVRGVLQAAGIQPRCTRRFQQRGIELPPGLFGAERWRDA